MPPWLSSTRSRSRSSPTMSATTMSARHCSRSRNSPTSCCAGATDDFRRDAAVRQSRLWPAPGVAASAACEHTMLFDTGTEGAIFIRNCANLGTRSRRGRVHRRHPRALGPHGRAAGGDRCHRRSSGGRVTVHVNPGMFNERGVLLKNGVVIPAAKVPTPAEMEAHGASGRERRRRSGCCSTGISITAARSPASARSRRAAPIISAGAATPRTGSPIPS